MESSCHGDVIATPVCVCVCEERKRERERRAERDPQGVELVLNAFTRPHLMCYSSPSSLPGSKHAVLLSEAKLDA